MSLDVYGLSTRTPVTVSGSLSEQIEDALRSVWARCLSPHPGGSIVDSEPVQLDLSESQSNGVPEEVQVRRALQSATQSITHAKIEAQAGKLLMLHAGAVATASGNTLAFVAPGGTGKTTMMRQLGNHYGYLTDETVAIDQQLAVRPYPKPLSIRTAPTSFEKKEVSPDDLRLVAPPASPVLKRIVLLDRHDDYEGEPVCEQLSLVDALVALTPETSSLARLPRPLTWFSDVLARLAPTVRLRYRDADTTLAAIAEMLEDRS